MEETEKLTSANIRYLLTMKAFADANKPIRNTYLAESLHYKKSSIHSMLKFLLSIGMIEKDENNVIHLTEQGADTADRYQAYYTLLDTMFVKQFPGFENRENAIFSLLAEIPEQALRQFRADE